MSTLPDPINIIVPVRRATCPWHQGTMVYHAGLHCSQVDYKIREGAFPAKLPKVHVRRARVSYSAIVYAEPGDVTRHVKQHRLY